MNSDLNEASDGFSSSSSRPRSYTWDGGQISEEVTIDDGSLINSSVSYTCTGEDDLKDDVLGKWPVNLKKPSARRNAWGCLSYADLIARAIESVPDKRLTLSQIYDWMVENIPYFKDKGESTSSAGWKNSIRHNLSLHRRFSRVANEGTGKSSWWVVNPDCKTVRVPRRRATSMSVKEQDSSVPGVTTTTNFVPRTSTGSPAFSRSGIDSRPLDSFVTAFSPHENRVRALSFGGFGGGPPAPPPRRTSPILRAMEAEEVEAVESWGYNWNDPTVVHSALSDLTSIEGNYGADIGIKLELEPGNVEQFVSSGYTVDECGSQFTVLQNVNDQWSSPSGTEANVEYGGSPSPLYHHESTPYVTTQELPHSHSLNTEYGRSPPSLYRLKSSQYTTSESPHSHAINTEYVSSPSPLYPLESTQYMTHAPHSSHALVSPTSDATEYQSIPAYSHDFPTTPTRERMCLSPPRLCSSDNYDTVVEGDGSYGNRESFSSYTTQPSGSDALPRYEQVYRGGTVSKPNDSDTPTQYESSAGCNFRSNDTVVPCSSFPPPALMLLGSSLKSSVLRQMLCSEDRSRSSSSASITGLSGGGGDEGRCGGDGVSEFRSGGGGRGGEGRSGVEGRGDDSRSSGVGGGGDEFRSQCEGGEDEGRSGDGGGELRSEGRGREDEGRCGNGGGVDAGRNVLFQDDEENVDSIEATQEVESSTDNEGVGTV